MHQAYCLLKKSLLAAALSAALSTAAQAEQVYSAAYGGRNFFELHFYGLEDGMGGTGLLQQDYELSADDMEQFRARADFSAQGISAALQAAELWAEVLSGSFAASSPVELSLIAVDWQEAAAGLSNKTSDGTFSAYTTVADKLLFDTTMRIPGIILIGEPGFELPEHLSALPLVSGFDFTASIAHEIGHLLGIGTTEEWQTVYSAHLYDCYGTQYDPSFTFYQYGGSSANKGPLAEDGVFNVGYSIKSEVYFKGEHVSEVLADSGLSGIPIDGWEVYDVDEAGNPTETLLDLSHLELERSMMSHQAYRNYTFFMEAELALLQDLGYQLDRRNFYGYSVYGDNQTLVNEHPFFERNADGTAYLAGAANTTTLGTGLHVYGKHNQITQAAPLLACGTAAVGIRVDGTDNHIIIPESTEIHADGSYGTGILFAYGMEHELQLDGTVTALGQDGVALRFDFGHNLLSDKPEDGGGYRGSYIWQHYYAEDTLFKEDGAVNNFDTETGFDLNLHGPLADKVTISGSIAGKQAAIYISENALVGGINFTSGAAVSGDIISLWDPENPLIDQYVQDHRDDFDLYTKLNFGAAADTASAAADDDFSMTLWGSIKGYESLQTRLLGGALTVSGYIDAYSLENDGALTVLSQDDDGYSIRLQQALTLAADSALNLAFDTESTTLKVKAQDIALDGTLGLTALPDFYQNNQSLEVAVSFDGAAVNGSFADFMVQSLNSPVLDFALQSPDNLQSGVFEITASRSQDAYAQFADDKTSSETGYALYALADAAAPGCSELFAVLDFSDGSTIGRALHSLSPEAYDEAVFASLQDKLSLGRRIFERQLSRFDFRESGSYAYAEVYGSELNTGRSDFKLESSGAGIIAGVDFKQSRALTLGLDLSLSALDADLNGVHSAQYEETSALAGFNLLYRPEAAGFYLASSVHAGMLQGKMKRSLQAGTFYSKASADWCAFTGSAQLGGYNFNLKTTDSEFNLGPFVLLQYAAENRPYLTESGSAALKLEDGWYDSLPVTAGLSLAVRTLTDEEVALTLSVRGGYYHELLDRTDSTTAAFKGSSYTFASSSTRPDWEGLIGELSVGAVFPGGFSASLNLSAQGFLDDAHSVGAGLELAYRF